METLDLLTPRQAGQLLRKSPGTLAIWRCTKRYPLAFVRLGNRIYYRRTDLEEFIANSVVRVRDRGHKL
jgi:Helix-turn-helix domain